jgi:hypothetical protein
MGKKESEIIRRRVNGRMGGRENGKMRSECISKENGDLEWKSVFKSLRIDM